MWAEEFGSITAGAHEWSFGNGSTDTNGEVGYPIPAAGRALRMGLSGSASGQAPGETSVSLTINGASANRGVTKASGQFSGTETFSPPIELAQGDVLNFRSSTTTNATAACVSLLIELDL